MAKFRKRPVVIEAVQWNGVNWTEVAELCGMSAMMFPEGLRIKTLEHRDGESLLASLGDWIIRGVKGEVYPIKDDIFRETYEEVDGAAS